MSIPVRPSTVTEQAASHRLPIRWATPRGSTTSSFSGDRQVVMLHEETRARLRQLVRSTQKKPAAGRLTCHHPARRDVAAVRRGLASGQQHTTDHGTFWMIDYPLTDMWPESVAYMAKWKQNRSHQLLQTPRDDYREFVRWFAHGTVFLDLETCGFAGSCVFLAGILHEKDGTLFLTQCWARDYSEERSMLLSLRDMLRSRQVLVTFNGKSFDWPQVRDRCVLHTKNANCDLPELVHFDLLHHARRRWKGELPNCKLQTLEKHLCGRIRHDDIPGSQIPAVYQDYVVDGKTHDVDRILHHNALDLITLLQVALML